MKLKTLTILFFLLTIYGFSQDTIVKTDGTSIQAKILEISSSEVKFKRHENLNGPLYTIQKTEIVSIHYENGFVEEFSQPKTVIKEESPTVVKIEENPSNNNSSESNNSGTKLSFKEKVRLYQNQDPTLNVFLGNSWIGRNGIFKPTMGFDVRFGRKNVFLRGLALGFRYNMAGIDNIADESVYYSEIYAFMFAVKYYAPMPIPIVQPYFVLNVGAALRNHYGASSPYHGNFYGDDVLPTVNTGIGANFMLLRHLGFFVEFGYFQIGYINTGLTFKIGKAAKRK